MKPVLFILFFGVLSIPASSQSPGSLWWRAVLHRADSEEIVFNFEWTNEKGKPIWVIRNATERIKVTDIQIKKDSLIVQMPTFESQFRVKKVKDKLVGVWIKGGSVRTTIMPFTATRGGQRFPSNEPAWQRVTGRWSVYFVLDSLSYTPALGEFDQRVNYVTGTFMTPTGDYRYLEGQVSNDTLRLSCFDGSHAYSFVALVSKDVIRKGWFYSGATSKQFWHAILNDTATLDREDVAMQLKPGEEKLHFTFKDLDGKPVSINDERFRNKVVIVQLMGSWCPNCMDETAFLSAYYNQNRQRGVEVVSLAYEYSTDRARSLKTLRKFQQRFNVQYPMLITGVTVNDSLRTEKTLPELTPIRFFPSAVIIDKQGRVRKIDTGFSGPATGEFYLAYKREFEETINALLDE